MAAIYITEEDNSLSVAGTPTIQGAMVIVADRGRVDRAVTVDKNSLISLYGKPNPNKSTTHYSAMSFLEKAGEMVVARTIHTALEGTVETDSNRTARYSAALIKHKVAGLPENIPDGSYTPERIVEPFLNQDGTGLTQKQIDSFTFPVYPRAREYAKAKNKVAVRVEDKPLLILNNFNGIKPNMKLSFGETVDDNSTVYEVLELNIVNAKIPQIKIKPCGKGLINVARGAVIRRVNTSVEDFNPAIKAAGDASAGKNTITLTSVTGVESGQTLSIGGKLYVVQSINTNSKVVTLRTTLEAQVTDQTEVKLEKRTYSDVEGNPIADRESKGSDTISVSDSDQILNGNRYTFMTGLTNAETEFIISEKLIYNEEQNQATLDRAVTTELDTVIQIMTASEFEERDVLLVYADNQGTWGNGVTVSIEPSNDYPDKCRVIRVFADGGDTGEKFEVSFEDFVDGLGKQLYIEDRINDNSNYIRVKHNKDAKDAEGNPALPLVNDYCVWRENPDDVFGPTSVKVLEDLNFGDTDITVSSYDEFNAGDRIRFGTFKEEYKVTGKSATEVNVGGSMKREYHITIDRGIQVDKIPVQSVVQKFSRQEFKKVQKIESQQLPNYNLNATYIIGTQIGKLLDCGTNKMTGGDNGSVPDIGDMIQTLDKVFSSREDININILLDGGVYNPIYQQRLDTLAQKREDCFAFLSGDPSALDHTDPVTAVIDVRNNQNINSSYSATFPDWIVVYDEYNKKNVTISTDGMAAALQSVASEGGVWGNVAAGWSTGKLFNVIKPAVVWTEAQREKLLNAQLNPIKKMKSRGLSFWGNKTNLASRSYLQMRNVRFLLLQLNIQLREYLEDIHWTFNDEATRTQVCTTIQDSFWNSYNSVLNGLQVMDRTTTQDEDAGNMRIYVAIQPKGVVENIYVTLGIFSNSNSITAE